MHQNTPFWRGLGEAVGAGGEEFQKTQIAQDLELLADFVADMAIVRVQSREFVGVSIDVGESEFGFAEGLNDLQDVDLRSSRPRGPTLFSCLQFFEGAGAAAEAAAEGLESSEELVNTDCGIAQDAAEGAEGDFVVKWNGNGKALRVG